MATMTLIGYETVDAIFRRVYEDLREANGEHAPNSYTWYEPTREELEENCPVGVNPVHHGVLGDVNRPVIAWAYQCEGRELVAIHDDAMAADVEVFFRYCLGLED